MTQVTKDFEGPYLIPTHNVDYNFRPRRLLAYLDLDYLNVDFENFLL